MVQCAGEQTHHHFSQLFQVPETFGDTSIKSAEDYTLANNEDLFTPGFHKETPFASFALLARCWAAPWRTWP